jgi:hypothetical protein
VKAVPAEIASGLDLNDAWDQDRVTDKATLHLQRVYLTIVLGIASFAKHVSRLRSWKQTRRASAFCAVRWPQVHFRVTPPEEAVH